MKEMILCIKGYRDKDVCSFFTEAKQLANANCYSQQFGNFPKIEKINSYFIALTVTLGQFQKTIKLKSNLDFQHLFGVMVSLFRAFIEMIKLGFLYLFNRIRFTLTYQKLQNQKTLLNSSGHEYLENRF